MTNSIGKDFINKTKYPHLPLAHQNQGIVQPPLELEYTPDMEIINLPTPTEFTLPEYPLKKAIEDRRSIRKYSSSPLTLQELSWLLWATQGVQSNLHGKATLRTSPSAGARHALETFLAVNNVETLEPGLYRYLALEHKLVKVSANPAIGKQVSQAALGQAMIQANSVTFIWVAVPYRMTWRYSERGYRYLYLDVGHICQNLYLAAENINTGVCAIAAFDDDQMNQVLHLDGEDVFAIYLASVGKR